MPGPESTIDSQETESTASTANTDSTGATLAVGKIPAYKYSQEDSDVLPQLPSHKFKYSVWHDLRQPRLSGDELHAPRIRDGPSEKEKEFYKLEDEGIAIHHSLRGRTRQNHMIVQENWENALAINLSYQELQTDYQVKNFYRILHRLQSAITVNLVSNNIASLKKHWFPSCEYLNLNKNYIISFSLLPVTPSIRCLSADFNCIGSFKHLARFASTPLTDLSLKGNPISFWVNYRQRVFLTLPYLQILDGIPKLASDDVFQDVQDGSGCCIT